MLFVAVHESVADASRRLETIPGIGIVGATTIAAIVTDPKAFKSARDFAAWIGLVPRQDATGVSDISTCETDLAA